METCTNTMVDKELLESGKKLIKAARDFWEVHQKACGPRAVVWLKDDAGGLVLFTRGEYKDQIMENVGFLSEEIPLINPFQKRGE